MFGRFYPSKPEEKTGPRLVHPAGPGDASAGGDMKNGGPSLEAAQRAASDAEHVLVDLRVSLHRFLLDRLNLGVIDQIERSDLEERIRPLVRQYIRDINSPLNAAEIDNLVVSTTDEMLGLGPIEPLLKDDTVSDILINTPHQVYVERAGVLELTPIRFKDDDHLIRTVNKIVSAVGRRVDESSPMVDARLADGSRVNVAIKPIAVDGTLVSIRKFSKRPYTLGRLVENRSMGSVMRDLLTAAVKARTSLVVSGGTGSGKTTLLNALSAEISVKERLITIEDAAELQLQQPHVARMETRPPNLDGRGEIRQRELLKNALRMRPDRIIVGECRGEEAFDMLQAMNTGHEGSMTTVHANTPRDAIGRLEQMVGMAGLPMSQMSIRAQIASALRMVVQTQRMSDGTRRVTSVSEITGMEGEVIQMQEIYRYVRTGITEEGTVLGEFRATGVRPRFIEDAELAGFHFGREAFDPTIPL